MDVVFALDSSGDLSFSDYSQQKNFVLTMINAFTISDTKTHVGVITVGETARRDIELTQYNQPGILKTRVTELNALGDTPSDPTTRLTDMLQKAWLVFNNGGRSQVRVASFCAFIPYLYFVKVVIIFIVIVIVIVIVVIRLSLSSLVAYYSRRLSRFP